MPRGLSTDGSKTTTTAPRPPTAQQTGILWFVVGETYPAVSSVAGCSQTGAGGSPTGDVAGERPCSGLRITAFNSRSNAVICVSRFLEARFHDSNSRERLRSGTDDCPYRKLDLGKKKGKVRDPRRPNHSGCRFMTASLAAKTHKVSASRAWRMVLVFIVSAYI
jgi:hypothetical protein